MSAYRLTPKQRLFKINTLNGMDPSEAYIKAGYKTDKMSKRVISVEAQRVLKNPSVALAIKEGDVDATSRAVKASAFTKEKALRWAEEDRVLAHSLGQSGAAVSSNRLACDIAGLIVDKKDVTHHDGEFANLTAAERERARDAIRGELESRFGGDGPARQPGSTKPLQTLQ